MAASVQTSHTLFARLGRRLTLCLIINGLIFGSAVGCWLVDFHGAAMILGITGLLWFWCIVAPTSARMRMYRWVLAANDQQAPPLPQQPDSAIALLESETLVLSRSPRAHVFAMLPANALYVLAGVFMSGWGGMGNPMTRQNVALLAAITPQRIKADTLGITARSGWGGERRALWQDVRGMWDERQQAWQARRIHLITADDVLVIRLFASRALCKTEPDEAAYHQSMQRLLATACAQSQAPLRAKRGE